MGKNQTLAVLWLWGTLNTLNPFLPIPQRSPICLHGTRWMKSPKGWYRSWKGSFLAILPPSTTYMSTSFPDRGRTCMLFSAFPQWVFHFTYLYIGGATSLNALSSPSLMRWFAQKWTLVISSPPLISTDQNHTKEWKLSILISSYCISYHFDFLETEIIWF